MKFFAALLLLSQWISSSAALPKYESPVKMEADGVLATIEDQNSYQLEPFMVFHHLNLVFPL